MPFSAINHFKAKLRSGQVMLGPAVSFADPLVSEALASSSDFIWIDLEHSAMSPEAWCGHLLACRSRGIPGIVRLPAGGVGFIKPALDSGADGIIIPQVRSVEEVMQIVADCRYPPLGQAWFWPARIVGLFPQRKRRIRCPGQ